jgi:hypothetical protein
MCVLLNTLDEPLSCIQGITEFLDHFNAPFVSQEEMCYTEMAAAAATTTTTSSKIGKVYSLEYTDIPNEFFVPRRMHHFYT